VPLWCTSFNAVPQIVKRIPNNGPVVLSPSGLLFLQEKLNVEGSGDQAGPAGKEVVQRSDPFRVGRNELRKIEVDRAVDRCARFLEVCDALARDLPIDSESRHCPGCGLRDPERHARHRAHAVPQKREEARRP